MTKTYKQTVNNMLSDGSIKSYTYIRHYNYISQKKETYFDMLMKYEEVKKIIKNDNVKPSDKLNFVIKFIEDKDEFYNLTLSQIRNFVYRNVDRKEFNIFDCLISHNEVKEILKRRLPIKEKITMIKEFITDKDNLNTLSDTQIRNFICRNQETKTGTYFDILLNHNEIKNILKDDSLTNSEKVDKIKKYVDDSDEFKKLDITQIRNFVYRNIKKY